MLPQLSKKEQAALDEKSAGVAAKLATAASDVGMVVMTASVFTGVGEGFMRGCFAEKTLQVMRRDPPTRSLV